MSESSPSPIVDGPCRYPSIVVELVGTDGNAFSIIGKVTRALLRAGVTSEEVDKFHAEATSGDYDHVLVTAMRWVECN